MRKKLLSVITPSHEGSGDSLHRWSVDQKCGFLFTPSGNPMPDKFSNAINLSNRIQEFNAKPLSELEAEISKTHFPTDMSDLDTAQIRNYHRSLAFTLHIFLLLKDKELSEEKGTAGKKTVILMPENLHDALVASTTALNRPKHPTVTYAVDILANWQLLDPTKGVSLDNVTPVQLLSEKLDENGPEKWFYKIHIVIEHIAGKFLSELQSISNNQATFNDNIEGNARCIETMTETISEMSKTLMRMNEHCDENDFVFKVRPYLTAPKRPIQWKGASGRFSGASGAQSSFFPVIDSILSTKLSAMHQTQMPAEHQEFINNTSIDLKALVSGCGNSDLTERYNKFVDEAADFRKKHIDMVTSYITAIHGKDAKGTGGTSAISFLEKRYTKTLEAKILEPSSTPTKTDHLDGYAGEG